MGKTIMYERIYGDLLAKIQSGDYQPGDRLPSEKELAELYGVSRITAKKAMDMLAKENQINREPGDIVCYSGHVGIYVGNNTIVHASTPSSGIKYSTATYRNVLSVRRIF